jgi:hypothetical protein
VCFTASDYDDIDTDVAAIAAAFTSNETLGYFWEGWLGNLLLFDKHGL